MSERASRSTPSVCFSFLSRCSLPLFSDHIVNLLSGRFSFSWFYAEKCCSAYVDYSVTFIIPYSLFLREAFIYFRCCCCCWCCCRRRRCCCCCWAFCFVCSTKRIHTCTPYIQCSSTNKVSFCFNLNFDVHASCQWLFMSLSVHKIVCQPFKLLTGSTRRRRRHQRLFLSVHISFEICNCHWIRSPSRSFEFKFFASNFQVSINWSIRFRTVFSPCIHLLAHLWTYILSTTIDVYSQIHILNSSIMTAKSSNSIESHFVKPIVRTMFVLFFFLCRFCFAWLKWISVQWIHNSRRWIDNVSHVPAPISVRIFENINRPQFLYVFFSVFILFEFSSITLVGIYVHFGLRLACVYMLVLFGRFAK